MATGIIPSKVDECTLNIYVSQVDCSPSKKFAKQISATNTTFDKVKFANGGYTLLHVKYTSPDSISGFQFEVDAVKHHYSRIVAVGTKIGEGSEEGSETNSKNYLVWPSKNKVLGIIDPDISGSALSTSYNLATASTDTTLCYILLEKKKSFTSANVCPEEVKIKNIKACRNINLTSVSVLSEPKANWKGRISKELGLTDIYFASKLFATNTYNRDLDANNDGTIDVVDIVALANKKHNLNWDKSNTSILPQYVCKDHEDFVTKSDLSADLQLMSVEIVSNSENSKLHDATFTFGVRSSNSISGMQFDFGQDMFGSSEGKETLSFLGPLKEFEKTWNYKFETISGRFNRDRNTRFLVWQGPIDANKAHIKHDLTAAEQIQVINSLEPQNILTPILKYTITGNDLNNFSLPTKRYYYADELGGEIQSKQEILNAKRKGDRYYGPVNKREDNNYYTGKVYSPNTSRRLDAKWREFGILNERIITNDYLNYYEHLDQKLEYAGFNLVYNPTTANLDYFENDFEAYADYIINYLYMTKAMRGGLDSQLSEYNYEPSGAINPRHDGYISEATLDGLFDVCDVSSFVNLATQKLSAFESSTINVLKSLIRNTTQLARHEVIDSSNPASISDICEDVEVWANLKSLSKIVPTYILNNRTTTAFPHHEPSIVTQNTDGAIIYFGEIVSVTGSNQPAEFQNWSEYFYDLHNVKLHELPEVLEYSFVEIKLATNTPDINFITSAEFTLDYSNALPGLGQKFWLYPGDGFSGSYNLTARANSSSGSQLDLINSTLPADSLGRKIYVKLDITGSTTLACPITYDGGALTLAKIFVQEIPDFISGKYIGFNTDHGTGSIESVGKPLDRSGSVNYLKYTTDDRVVYGPSSSYLSQQYAHNSSSPQTYADYLLHLKAVGPAEIDVEYTTIKPFNTASFEIRAINGIEIDSINANLYYPLLGHTSSLSSSNSNDGKTNVTFYATPGQLVSGSGKLMRLKTSRQLFDYELLQSGRELISPAWGASADLIIPNINKTIIFPTTDNLILHIDPSKEQWVKTATSGTFTVVKELANPYGIPNLSQSIPTGSGSSPKWENSVGKPWQQDPFTQNMHYINFEQPGDTAVTESFGYQSFSSSLNAQRLDIVDLQKFTLLSVFSPDSVKGTLEQTIFVASSSTNLIKLELVGNGIASSNGGLRITTSGSTSRTFNYNFDSDFSIFSGSLIVITSDGTDSTVSASIVRYNGAFGTASESTLTSSVADSTTYVIGGPSLPPTEYYKGYLGETILFNDVLSSENINIFEGYLAHKWGLNTLLPSAHTYRYITPNTSNTLVNNSATSAAIKKSQDYFVGSGSASDRSGARAISKIIGLNDVTVASGSTVFTKPDLNLFRELPIEINQSRSANDTSIFVNSYKDGILELGYKSPEKVDGYWVQLGNSISGSVYSPSRVGIVSVDKENNSETAKKQWTQFIGYGPNEIDIYNKDPKRIRALKQIAFGFSSGRVKKSANSLRDGYRTEGASYIPASPSGSSYILTNLKVDPKSFNGVPTIASWKLVTNVNPVAATSSWTGSVDGGSVIRFSDLTAVIGYAQQGYYNTSSAISTVATQSQYFDAEGSGGNIDIIDILTVSNSLISGSGAHTRSIGANIVPKDVSTNVDAAPSALTVTATVKSCDSGSAVAVGWTPTGSAKGFEIWRRNSASLTNKRKRSLNFMFTGNREELFAKTQEFKRIKIINTGSVNSYVDKEAPYNINCCSDSDNPLIDYVVIAFNDGGEAVGQSSTIQLPCCNSVPVANTSNVTSSANTPVTFTLNVTDNSAPPPFGTASADTDDISTLKFNITEYHNGYFDELSNYSGVFTFIPNKNFLGKTNISYEAINSAGCKANSKVTLVFTPSKFTPTTTVIPAFDQIRYETVKLSWDRKDVKGKILKYEIYRVVSGSAFGSTSLIKTISGKLPITDQSVNYYDRVTSSGDWAYKITAYGFQGNADTAISTNSYSQIDSETVYVTTRTGSISNNPSVTITTSSYQSASHPWASASWAGVTDPEAQYYKVYRNIFSSLDKYVHIGTVGGVSSSTYTFIDGTLPPPVSRTKYGLVDYVAKYRVTSVSYYGENGNPNVDWGGSTYSASIRGTSLTPQVRDAEFIFCNPSGSPAYTTEIGTLVTNEVPSDVTFQITGSGLTGLTLSTSGGVTYSGSVDGTFTFNYEVVSGGKTSDPGTITLRVLDCGDLTCPYGEKAKHIICDAYDIHGQYIKTVDEVPLGLREKGGQVIRKSPKPYAVTRGYRSISGSW